jgi:LCP family protein required for cell wall assembly
VYGLKFGSAVIGHVGYAATCLAAVVLLVVAGYAHQTVGELDALGAKGIGIPGSPSVGAMNILVMGLESRTNFEGQTLSAHQLKETHSGSVKGVNEDGVGAQDTDTLILIHIFAGGHKAVGFSIPRDDVVNFPHATLDGLTEGKIDAAYDYAYNQYVDDNTGKMSSDALYLGANQAGQLFEIQTVESVTGVHIDHFAESNIIGFYYLAQQFGGMEVCIKPAPAQDGFAAGANLTDKDAQTNTDNSGFSGYQDGYNRKKGGTQYLHLSPAQSLAYVRSRDTLPGVDIGRTARQQAAIDYVIWKLKNEGVLSDLGAITTLLTTAKDYLITDSGWNLADFATDMSALTGKNLSFSTLASAPANNVPVPGYPSPQSVNFIDGPAIQRDIKQAFYGSAPTPTPPATSVTVDVYNSSGAPGLAGQASQALAALGYKTGKAANSTAQSQTVTADNQVFYGAGTELNAESIANDLGTKTMAAPLSSLPAGHVEVLLGSAVTALPPGLLAYGAATVTAQDYASAAAADGLSPAAVPTTTPTPTASTAGTQSVGAAILGARAADASATAKKPTPKPSKSSAGTASGAVTVGPNARYGIPCVY